MTRIPTRLPLHGDGTYRFCLVYFPWKRGTVVPVYNDDGVLPYFASREEAEAAAIRHNLPWAKLALEGFTVSTWAAFEQHQQFLEAYRANMMFDAARQEAQEGRLRRVAQPVVVEV